MCAYHWPRLTSSVLFCHHQLLIFKPPCTLNVCCLFCCRHYEITITLILQYVLFRCFIKNLKCATLKKTLERYDLSHLICLLRVWNPAKLLCVANFLKRLAWIVTSVLEVDYTDNIYWNIDWWIEILTPTQQVIDTSKFSLAPHYLAQSVVRLNIKSLCTNICCSKRLYF